MHRLVSFCSWFSGYIFEGFKKSFIYLFLNRGEGREKERERNVSVWLPLVRPLLRTWPTTQACALTGNRTSNSLVCRPALKPLSHTSQGVFLSCDLILFHNYIEHLLLQGQTHTVEYFWRILAVLSSFYWILFPLFPIPPLPQLVRLALYFHFKVTSTHACCPYRCAGYRHCPSPWWGTACCILGVSWIDLCLFQAAAFREFICCWARSWSGLILFTA